MKVLLLEGISTKACDLFKNENMEVELLKGSLDEQELIKKIKNIDIIGVRSKTHITKKVLDVANNLKVVACFCIGSNQVDLNECTKKGITVFNSPYANTRSVAELVISEIVGLSRRLGDVNNDLHRGIWNKSSKGCYEIRGKTVGIIGYGHVGSQVSVLAEAMGMNVIYYDILRVMPIGMAVGCNSMNEVLEKADYVTLHVPLTKQTNNMITKTQLNIMKKGSYLLNLSRGNVVNIDDLVNALNTDHLAGAAVDVYPKEPKVNGEFDMFHELRKCNNVILTPHIGGATTEAQGNIGVDVANKVIKYLSDGDTMYSLNIPRIDVNKYDYEVVIGNLHHNKPGMLSKILNCVSSCGLNILSHRLATDGDVGYCILGIEKRDFDYNRLVEDIAQHDGCIKTRIYL